MTHPAPGQLRAWRQARTRAAIVTAAIELFTDRGYDTVTVSDIALRAEIGRTTFFRYFKDKSDVLFADDAELGDTLVTAAEQAANTTPHTDRDGSLGHALAMAHAAMRALTERIAAYADTLAAYNRLIRGHDGLFARSLLRQQQYMDDLAAVLRRHHVPAPTATLAAQLALACYRTAHAAQVEHPDRLVAALDEAFAELHRLGAAPKTAGNGYGTSSARPAGSARSSNSATVSPSSG